MLEFKVSALITVASWRASFMSFYRMLHLRMYVNSHHPVMSVSTIIRQKALLSFVLKMSLP